jgi:hypothetical protein
MPNKKMKESTALLPDFSSKLCGLNFNLYTGTQGGAFFVLDVQMQKKKRKKNLHVPANACSPCKKNLQNCIVIPALSLSPQNGYPFFILNILINV